MSALIPPSWSSTQGGFSTQGESRISFQDHFPELLSAAVPQKTWIFLNLTDAPGIVWMVGALDFYTRITNMQLNFAEAAIKTVKFRSQHTKTYEYFFHNNVLTLITDARYAPSSSGAVSISPSVRPSVRASVSCILVAQERESSELPLRCPQEV